jgi:hypothetical protein
MGGNDFVNFGTNVSMHSPEAIRAVNRSQRDGLIRRLDRCPVEGKLDTCLISLDLILHRTPMRTFCY